jgi:metal-dependent amidase/aminoacylase/carboxypeptidase family protein
MNMNIVLLDDQIKLTIKFLFWPGEQRIGYKLMLADGTIQIWKELEDKLFECFFTNS